MHYRKRPASQAIRKLMKKFDRHCVYCEVEVHAVFVEKGQPPPSDAATRDHFIPLSMGGQDTIENMVLCCHGCNQLKGKYNPLIAHEFFRRFGVEKLLKLARQLNVHVPALSVVPDKSAHPPITHESDTSASPSSSGPAPTPQ